MLVVNVSILRMIIVRSYLWLRDESSSGDGEAVVDRTEILSHDGKTAPLFGACAGRQSLGVEKNSRLAMINQ